MTDREIQLRMHEAEMYFSQSHTSVVAEAKKLYFSFPSIAHLELEKVLSQLPTKESLLQELIGKLKGKSVCRNLRRIVEGKETNRFVLMKGLFSLGTHAAIECEKGNSQFAALLPFLYEKIGVQIYGSDNV